jgi:hypothetical protein
MVLVAALCKDYPKLRIHEYKLAWSIISRTLKLYKGGFLVLPA